MAVVCGHLQPWCWLAMPWGPASPRAEGMALLPGSRALGRGTCRLAHAHVWWLVLVLWPLTGLLTVWLC